MTLRLRDFNWISFVAMIALIVAGTTVIWSAGNARPEIRFHGMWISNLTTAAFGLVVYFVLAVCDYRKILGWCSPVAYVAALVMLVAVLLFGSSVYGGRRWLWFFQPSEVAKLCVISFAAYLMGPARRRIGDGVGAFLTVSAVLGVPAVLILAEPDLGTTLTLVPAVFVMMFVARVWRIGLVSILGVFALVAALLFGAVYEAAKPGVTEARREAILRCVPLRPHQVRRVETFLFPDRDPRGAGYTLMQAKISIGSGGLRGKGLGKGETNHLKYLPQSISMNDFIFCVWAEEMGFIGSLVLLALYGALIVPGVWVAYRSTDVGGRLLALGISTLVFAHVYVNIAMSLGLVPITGLPLPFMSSGRTFLVVVMSGFGLIQSVSLHGKENE